TAAVDVGLTDALDPILGNRLGPLLDRIDARAGARVDETGIEVRRLLRTVHVPWDRVARVRLDSRLDLLLTLGVGLLPIARAPWLGPVVTGVTDRFADEVTRRLLPGVRRRVGWAVATIEQQTWRSDVTFRRTAGVVALLYPSV